MKELIVPQKVNKIKEKLRELLLRSWKTSRPFFPRMRLIFRVSPIEKYFSTAGSVFWYTPYWRGEDFARAILFHEGHHWNIFPVSVWRSLEEVFKVRELLAEEKGFQPKKIQRGLYHVEEDWSGFKYSIAEIQFVQNILGDYLVNWHIHDNYPTVWKALWDFLYKEGKFYLKDKNLKRDTTFELYLAVYSHLIPGVDPYPLKTKMARGKIEKIAEIVRACKLKKITTIYATRELVKIFHPHIEADFREQERRKGKGSSEAMKCPKCGNDEFEITAYQDENGNWVKV